MPTIAVLVTDSWTRRLAAEQIGSRATTLFCASVAELSDHLGRGGVDVVVADLQDETGAGVVSAFGALRREAPEIPLVIFCPPTPAALRVVPDIVALGRRLDLVFQGADHLGLALMPFLQPLRVARPGETLARHLVPITPVPFRPFIATVALKASPRLRVGTAARWSGLSRRTLERSLQHAGLPSAAALLGSCTALHAAWWLDVQGWSAKHVVTEMGFSHKSALNRALKNYLGCSSKSLPDEGGFPGLLARFETTLIAGAL